jgi:hypothetical protein
MTSSKKRIEREQQFHDLRYTDEQQRQLYDQNLTTKRKSNFY